MAIKNWLVRGDTHGNFLWMTNGCLDNYIPEETAIVILGDCGFDFYLNKVDERKKAEVNARGYRIYWLRGNHEARPQDIPSYQTYYDKDVQGTVYYNPEFPNLRAFLDYGFYKIGDYLCLIIGGAYSVDKEWRLSRVNLTEETNNPKKSGWFNNEQLNEQERYDCLDTIHYWTSVGGLNKVDFVLTHTCPKSFQPIDMFLSFIDQSKVDTTMEDFLEEIKRIVPYDIWLFGHYHTNRIELPHVEQYYNDIESFDKIKARWEEFDKTGKLDWWLVKSPKFKEVTTNA